MFSSCALCCAVAGADLACSVPPPPAPQEYVNGQLKNKYGDAFIRGNNGECAPDAKATSGRLCLALLFLSTQPDPPRRPRRAQLTMTCLPPSRRRSALYQHGEGQVIGGIRSRSYLENII